MKKLTALFLALIFAFSIIGCSASTSQATETPSTNVADTTPSPDETQNTDPVELTISAAASLTASLDEVIASYAGVAPHVKITVNYGGSGALQTQIENGAPADIFFSAAAKQMDALEDGGFIVSDSRINVLKNEIVLIVPSTSTLSISSFEDVATDAVSQIALGDVKSVPAGQYAQETFTTLNLWDAVSAKTIFATDVKQVLSWVSSGDVDCGVVYQTDAVLDNTVKIIASAPTDSHKAVVYPVAIVKTSENQDAAADFIAYLQSQAGMDVFTSYGFLAD